MLERKRTKNGGKLKNVGKNLGEKRGEIAKSDRKKCQKIRENGEK